jgi:phage shock protein C
MYCANCGNALEEHFRYCSRCGMATANVPSPPAQEGTRLTRIFEGKRIAGVCGGFARYLDVDPTLVRVVWILLTIFPPVPGIIAYIICWIVMPQDPPRSAHASAAAEGPAAV